MTQEEQTSHEPQDLANTFQTATFLEKQDEGFVFSLKGEHKALVLAEEFAQGTEPSKGQELELLVEESKTDTLWSASAQKALKLRAFETFERLGKENAIIEGVIVGEQRGGLIVDAGVRAFLPWSHVDLHHVEDSSPYMGRTSSFEVLDFDAKRCQFILSRKKVLKRAQKAAQKELAKTIEPGQKFQGVVRGVKPYGAFVDIGGLQGLLHVSNMSWGRIHHAEELVSLGDELEVVVISYDAKKKRLKLGRKQLLEDPWQTAVTSISEGAVMQGKVVSLTNFGAFVEIIPGLEGLIHVTEFSWTDRIAHPKDVLSVGDEVSVKVLSIDTEERRIALSVKQLKENPWEVVAKELPVGSKINGPVTSIVDFGLFVEVVPGIEGLVHTSNVSWSESNLNLAQEFSQGQTVDVIVLDVDADAQRLDLGIKQLSQDPWEAASSWLKPGQKIKATITRLSDFGAFAQVAQDVEGLIHISEISEDRVENIQSVLKVGQEVEALVLSFDQANQRLSLSMKRDSLDEPEDISAYTDEDAATNTLGDILREQLGLAAEGASEQE